MNKEDLMWEPTSDNLRRMVGKCLMGLGISPESNDGKDFTTAFIKEMAIQDLFMVAPRIISNIKEDFTGLMVADKTYNIYIFAPSGSTKISKTFRIDYSLYPMVDDRFNNHVDKSVKYDVARHLVNCVIDHMHIPVLEITQEEIDNHKFSIPIPRAYNLTEMKDDEHQPVHNQDEG